MLSWFQVVHVSLDMLREGLLLDLIDAACPVGVRAPHELRVIRALPSRYEGMASFYVVVRSSTA